MTSFQMLEVHWDCLLVDPRWDNYPDDRKLRWYWGFMSELAIWKHRHQWLSFSCSKTSVGRLKWCFFLLCFNESAKWARTPANWRILKTKNKKSHFATSHFRANECCVQVSCSHSHLLPQTVEENSSVTTEYPEEFYWRVGETCHSPFGAIPCRNVRGSCLQTKWCFCATANWKF